MLRRFKPFAALAALLALTACERTGATHRGGTAGVESMPRVSDTMESSIAKSRTVTPDDGPGAAERDTLREEVIRTAREMRADPCDPALKRGYLKAVTAYARAKLKAARGDPAVVDAQWSSLLDRHAVQTMELQVSDGFVSEGDQMSAVMAHNLAAAAFWRMSGRTPEMAADGTEACRRFKNSEAQPELKLKDPRDEPAPVHRDRDAAREENRENARAVAMKALSVDTASLCVGRNKDALVEALKYYWDQRSGELWNAEHVRQRDVEETRAAWQSPADREIEAQTVELIRQGHLTKRDVIKRQRDEFEPLFARAGRPARACA